jgi:hypothetical protein
MADYTPVTSQQKLPPQMTLADMMNLAGGIQQYQQAQQLNPVQLEAARTNLSRLQQLTPLEVRGKTAETLASEGTLKPRITEAEEKANQAGISTQSMQMDFVNKKVIGIANRLTPLINHPLMVAAEQNPEAVNPDKLQQLIKNYGEEQANSLGIPKDQADQLIQPYLEQAKNPSAIRQFLKDKLLSTLDQGARLTAMQPSGVSINTGAGGGVVSTSQFGPYVPGTTLPGTAYIQQLPPTQEVVDPVTGQKRLIGPAGGNTPPLTTNLTAAQQAALTASANVISEDLPRTISEAKDAPARIGVLQNIKKLAPDAFTGPTAERRQMVTSFAQMLGMDVGKLETASTDELMKNSALLQLAGGNTDAARALAQFANPNNKMSKEGIAKVVDQLTGIEKMRLARSNYLSPAQNDAAQYSQRKQEFDSISDPRIFQEMTREDVQKLRKSMSLAEQKQMSNMVQKARRLGVLQ